MSDLASVLRAAATLEHAARQSHQHALERRRKIIRRARDAGMTLDAIAAELGVTRAAVVFQLRERNTQ